MQGRDNLNLGRNFWLPFRLLRLDLLACIPRRSMSHPLEVAFVAEIHFPAGWFNIAIPLWGKANVSFRSVSSPTFCSMKISSYWASLITSLCVGYKWVQVYPTLKPKVFLKCCANLVSFCHPPYLQLSNLLLQADGSHPLSVPLDTLPTPCPTTLVICLLSLTQFPQIWQTTVFSLSLKRNTAPSCQYTENLVKQM